MITATFSSKDRNWQNESTTYWFVINGTDRGTEKSFDNQTFGIVDCNGDKSVVEADGSPTSNEYITQIVLRDCKITDAMLTS